MSLLSAYTDAKLERFGTVRDLRAEAQRPVPPPLLLVRRGRVVTVETLADDALDRHCYETRAFQERMRLENRARASR